MLRFLPVTHNLWELPRLTHFWMNLNKYPHLSTTEAKNINWKFNLQIKRLKKSPWILKCCPWNVLECPWILSWQNPMNPGDGNYYGVDAWNGSFIFQGWPVRDLCEDSGGEQPGTRVHAGVQQGRHGVSRGHAGRTHESVHTRGDRDDKERSRGESLTIISCLGDVVFQIFWTAQRNHMIHMYLNKTAYYRYNWNQMWIFSLFFYLFPIWDRRMEFSFSMFSGFVLFLGTRVFLSCLFV